jgi:hypothetical protein
VLASSWPLMGALFIDGGAIAGCAIDGGDRSRREAITMPTASEATPINIP